MNKYNLYHTKNECYLQWVVKKTNYNTFTENTENTKQNLHMSIPNII